MSVRAVKRALNSFCWQSAHEILTVAEGLDDTLDYADLKIMLRRLVLSGAIDRHEVVRRDASGRSIRRSFLYRLHPAPTTVSWRARVPPSHRRIISILAGPEPSCNLRVASGCLSPPLVLEKYVSMARGNNPGPPPRN